MTLIAIHIAAKSDPSGNPRRALILIDGNGRKVAAVDEGYAGEYGALRDAGFADVADADRIVAHRFDVSVRQYRAALRDYPNTAAELEAKRAAELEAERERQIARDEADVGPNLGGSPMTDDDDPTSVIAEFGP